MSDAGVTARSLRSRKQDLKRLGPVAGAIRYAQHRDLTPQDVLLASYPKSGNTWVRFMLGQLLAGREVTWDDLGDFVPMVNRTRFAVSRLADGGRLVKTHDQCLRTYRTPGRRAVYLARDGRDVAVSYYHHQVGEGTFDGSFDAFLGRFLAGRADRYGTWASHVKSWTRQAGPVSVLLLRYEDVLRDPSGSLDDICTFVGLPVERTTIDRVVEDNRRDRMRAKEQDSSYLDSRRVRDVPFVRAARSGTWRDTFTEEQNERFMAAAGDAMEQLGFTA
jgi:hypothetical protein